MNTRILILVLMFAIPAFGASDTSLRIMELVAVSLFPERDADEYACIPEQVPIVKEREKKAEARYKEIMASYLDEKFTQQELERIEQLLSDPMLVRFGKVLSIPSEDRPEMNARIQEVYTGIYDGIEMKVREPVEGGNSE